MDLLERPTEASRRHPWEVSRFRFFRRVLNDAGALRTTRRVLDVGSGDSWFSRSLMPSFPADTQLTCWDANYDATVIASLAKEAGPRIEFVSQRPSGRFDLAMLLDVLEHVEHDAAFLQSVVRENLAPGATVLVSVPAWPSLFTAHDARLRHHRRYTPEAGEALLTGAGLEVIQRGGLFHSLLVPRVLEKVREVLRPPTSTAHVPSLTWRGGALATGLVEWSLAADNQLSLFASRLPSQLPGLTWWALCRAS